MSGFTVVATAAGPPDDGCPAATPRLSGMPDGVSQLLPMACGTTAGALPSAAMHRRWRSCITAVLFVVTANAARLVHVLRGRRTVRRSLWAGTPIINMAINARAERLLGVEADSLVYETYHVTREFTHDLRRWMKWRPLRLLVPYAVLVLAACRYQRFHFYCDRGILPPRSSGRGRFDQRAGYAFDEGELALLKSLGKEIFFWTYGADVRTQQRTRALGRFNCCTDCPEPGRYCVCDEDAGRENHDTIRKYATAIFALGDMTQYTPGSINDLFFWPIDLQADRGRRYAPQYPDPNAMGPIRVVHAANHRVFRGTKYLIEAVDRLRQQGHEIDLALVERTPNEQALELYRGADIIFDNCLIGSYGFFGLEAMALGKPVMAFIRKPGEYLLAPEECPIINTPADQVEAKLRELLTDRGRLHELGRRGRAYIEKHHSLEAFAARLARAYERLGVGRNA